MSSPRFSIVIPTRDGTPTLRSTLQTCLNQAYDDYEIVISDNGTTPATRHLVDELASRRIRYVRPDHPMAMSSHWDFAINQASGEYVTVLGDDDGLLPHALPALEHIARLHPAEAIRWNAAFYIWPQVAVPSEANYLRIPTSNEIDTVDSREAVACVIRFSRCYSSLPMVYNSIVRRSLLDDLRRRFGRVCASRYPDVYSGFLIAACTKQYTSVGLPMTVAGLSSKSIGVGHHFVPQQNDRGRDFLQLNAAEQIALHPIVPNLHVFPGIPIADCFLKVKDVVHPDQQDLVLDRKRLLEHIMDCLRTETAEHWNQCLGAIRASLGDSPELINWFDKTLAHRPPNTKRSPGLRSDVLGFDADFLHLDATALNIQDVHGAAKFCGTLLGCRPDTVSQYFGRRTAGQITTSLRYLLGGDDSLQQMLHTLEVRFRGEDAQRRQLIAQSAELARLRRFTRVPRAIYRALKAAGRHLTRTTRP